MGLYGTIVVEPTDPDYWPQVNRELTLTLDDILLTDGTVAPFSRNRTTHTAMGRFGDVFLVNGDPDLKLTARAGEVVRLYLVNTANTRVFNVAIPGARMKLVGGDSGRYEHEEFVQEVMLAPSERVVVDVQFTEPGTVTMEHHTPDRVYPLAEITVTAQRVARDLADAFGILRTNADMVAERDRITPMLDTAPDKTVAFVAEMDTIAPDTDPGAAVIYVCPMHPEVTSPEPARCPDCGMKLLPTAAPTAGYACPMHPEVTSTEPSRCPDCGMKLVPAHLVGSPTGHDDHQSHADHQKSRGPPGPLSARRLSRRPAVRGPPSRGPRPGRGGHRVGR
jgi:FtsP/CotA-like multicopper oxidase with cupredoxin domain